MKTHLLMYLCCIALLLTACTNDEPEQPTVSTPKQTAELAYKITPKQAIEIGNQYIASLSDVPTRSNRSVASIEAIRNDKGTRSDSSTPDTLLYVINYEDGQGFALVSADTRAYPVYAVSDTDAFEITETTNPNVIDFLENAKSDVVEKTASADVIADGPIFIPTPPPVLPPLYETIKPLVSARQGRLGLTDMKMFKYVVNDNGEPAKTCCVPLALEIAMSYHKWPTSLEGYTFDWDAMNAGTDDDGIARMLAILSSRDYCHVIKNTIDSIGYAYISNTIRSLKKMQYEITTDNPRFAKFGMEPVNNTIINLLKNNGPVLVEGRNSMPQHAGTGHIWVVDGLHQTFVRVMEGSYIKYEKFNMYHCIWGDDGRCNGYYLAEGNIFDGEPDSYDPIDSGEKEDYVFRGFYNLTYFGDFRANK